MNVMALLLRTKVSFWANCAGFLALDAGNEWARLTEEGMVTLN